MERTGERYAYGQMLSTHHYYPLGVQVVHQDVACKAMPYERRLHEVWLCACMHGGLGADWVVVILTLGTLTFVRACSARPLRPSLKPLRLTLEFGLKPYR